MGCETYSEDSIGIAIQISLSLHNVYEKIVLDYLVHTQKRNKPNSYITSDNNLY